MRKILLVEDNEIIVKGLKYLLEQEKFDIKIAKNIVEAKTMIKKQKFDLYLLDITLPDGDGYEICQYVKKQKDVPVIFLTAKDEELNVVQCLDMGADDYITNPFGVMELISRVKAVLRRPGGTDEEKLIGIGQLFIDDEKRVAYVEDKPVELTYKEYELLKYLALNRGIVLTRDNIMDRIWSTDYEGESRTLDVHIKTLRHKLGDAGNYIKTVRNVGYFMDDEAH